MISVKNLTKIYKSGKIEVVALDSVSFELPEKGLVFIVGKSGSGKSTLLNMLGVLDDVTSGEIIFDGKNISQITDRDANAYRNSDLGIVYQNYNLFENESVKDNIKLGVGATERVLSEEEIDKVLKAVDLSEIRTKKVKNLSGGQKQRVAIARALVKNPKLILADEPTGNLDSKTAKIIFDLFKKISETKLVVIITHDIKSAFEYADRILHLQDGKVVEDLEKNEEFNVDEKGDFLYIDSNSEINNEEINKINKILRKSHRKLKIASKKYKPYKSNNTPQKTDGTFEHTKISFKQIFAMGLKILKHNKFSLIVTSILTILIIALLSLSTTFINFEGKSATIDTVKIYDSKSVVMRKGYSLTNSTSEIEKTFVVEANEADLTGLKNQKYNGNYYPIYNTATPHKVRVYNDATLQLPTSSNNFYWEWGSGTVVCDNNLLIKLFGEDYKVIAGSLYGLESNNSLIITDYYADALLYYNEEYKSLDKDDPYANIVNTSGMLQDRQRIGAVIQTDYKQRHKTIYDIHQKVIAGVMKVKDAMDLVEGTRAYQIFQDDVMSRLNFAFSINPKFYGSYSNEKTFAFIGNSYVGLNEESTANDYIRLDPGNYLLADSAFEKDDIVIKAFIYNKLFGTNISSNADPDFSEKVIYLHNFGIEQDIYDAPRYSTKLVIKDVESGDSGPIAHCSKQKIIELQDFYQMICGYVFDNPLEAHKMYENLTSEYYYCPQYSLGAVYNTINVASIFENIFESIFFVLIAIEFLLVFLHTNKTINKEKYALGIYKTLGYSNRHLTISVLIANALMMAFIFIGSTIATFGFSFMANYFLQGGFYLYTKNMLYYELKIVAFRFEHVALYSGLVLVFLSVAFLIPLLKIRKIKPNNIIREAKQ